MLLFISTPLGGCSDQIPLEVLLDVPGVVVDISQKCKHDSMAKLEKEDLEAWVDKNGPFPANCLVMMR